MEGKEDGGVGGTVGSRFKGAGEKGGMIKVKRWGSGDGKEGSFGFEGGAKKCGGCLICELMGG